MHILAFRYCDIIPLHNLTQSPDKSSYLKVGLEEACDVRLLLSANQSERSFQSEYSEYTISAFHFNEKHILFKQ